MQIIYSITPFIQDDVLNIVLGYPQHISLEHVNEHTIDIRYGIRYVKSREKLTQVSTSSSLTGFIIQLLEEQLLVPNNVWSFYTSLICINETKGVDSKIIEMLGRERIIEVYTTMLKLFEWHKRPICSAISITLNPYIPKFSSNIEECLSFTKELGLNANTKISDLSPKDIALLASRLYEVLTKSSRKKRNPNELLGKVYIMSNYAAPITEDPRYLHYILLTTLEKEGPYKVIAPLINDIYWYDLGLTMENEITIIHEVVDMILENKLKLSSTRNSVILEYEKRLPIVIVGEILESLGIIPEGNILIQCTSEENCFTSITEIMRAKKKIIVDEAVREGYWDPKSPWIIELGELSKLHHKALKVVA